MRAVLGRELHSFRDIALLQLERMRLIDVAHSWAKGTHNTYQQKLRYLRRFEKSFYGLDMLPVPSLQTPPSGPGIRLMWAAEAYSLQEGKEPDSTVAFNTVRSLRSAASYYHTIAMMTAHEGQLLLDRQQRLVHSDVRPTDDATHTFFARGLRVRIGDTPQPSWALLHRHVVWLDQYLRRSVEGSAQHADKLYWCRAGVANLLFWLGWLRSSEVFTLTWAQITLVYPIHSGRHDLPPGSGAILVTLAPETKSHRATAADLVIAFTTFTGFRLGQWLIHLRALDGCQPVDHRLLFRTPTGQPWTSAFYRTEFLYPALVAQAATDPYLRPFNTLPLLRQKFWSLHCYRRGARTHVSRRHRALGTRAATTDEVYEHARWRRSRSGEVVDVLYRQWTLRDRLRLTQFCM